ncbi:MAG TPA: M20/M25/M40 family metallo-hydrolase [Verrucomicrobiae bacterium]|nr:M20/M25/M40 family metallo-hydrolase [Verrucomicrobiae bacterium]
MARIRTRCIFALLAALIAVGAPSRAQMSAPASAPPASPSLSALEIEALGWLQDLIRINTTNPPGNELVAAKYIAGILQKEGIPSEIFESAPGRGFLVARLSSGPIPDPSRALLLMAHLDVVGVDKSKWTVDPFGGVIQGGYIYGRGSIDDKGPLTANLAVFISLKRSGAHLNRDVIFLAEGDEEAYGGMGMKFAVEQHWDKIAAGYALNEGGIEEIKDGKVQYVAIQASEKVPVNVDVIATGTSGHASMPRSDNPVVHLAAAVAKIGAYEAPVQLDSVTREYFEGLSSVEDEDTGKWMRALETSDRGDHAARWLSSASPMWNAMLRDTVSPTMLSAGIRPNVIPPTAKAVLNVRLLPGDLTEPFLAKLQELVNDPEIQIEAEPGGVETAPSSSLSSDLYNSIVRVAKQEFPGAAVIPMMSPYSTDSSYLRLRSVAAYGISPFPLEASDEMRVHSNDERLPVSSFNKGVEFLDALVRDFAVSK